MDRIIDIFTETAPEIRIAIICISSLLALAFGRKGIILLRPHRTLQAKARIIPLWPKSENLESDTEDVMLPSQRKSYGLKPNSAPQ